MLTKEVRYVRSLNCICYKELSQRMKVKYFITVEQMLEEVGSSLHFFLVVSFEAV